VVPASAKKLPLNVIPVEPKGLIVRSVGRVVNGVKSENSRLPTVTGIVPARAFSPPKASSPAVKLKIRKRLVMEPP